MAVPLRIALLLPEAAEARLLAAHLASVGCQAQRFAHEDELLRQPAESPAHQVLVLDDDESGPRLIDLLGRLRSRAGYGPAVVVLGCSGLESRVVAALNAGADDYLVRPLRLHEATARVLALQRRHAGAASPCAPLLLKVGHYELDCVGHRIALRGARIALSPKMFQLALLLFSNAGRVVSVAEIERMLWGRQIEPVSRRLAVLVSRTRAELALQPHNGVSLSAIAGHGYRLDQTLIGEGGVQLPAVAETAFA